MEKSKYFPRQPNEERFDRFDEEVTDIRNLAKRDAEEAARKYKEFIDRMGNLIMG